MSNKKTPIPPTVKHIARHHNEGVLQPQLVLRLADKTAEDKPIEQENYWKKYRELDGIEEHIAIFCGCKNREKLVSIGYKNKFQDTVPKSVSE